MKRIILLFVILFVDIYAFNINKIQIGMGLSPSLNNTHIVKKELSLDFTLKTSYDLYRYLNLEARYTKSFLHPSKLQHDYSYGAYLKPHYKFNNNINPYLLFGYSSNQLSRTNTNFINRTTTQTDISYGAGLQYDINKNWGIFFDYMKLIDKSTTNSNGAYAIRIENTTFGLNYRFNKSKKRVIVPTGYIKSNTSKIITPIIKKEKIKEPTNLLYFKRNTIKYNPLYKFNKNKAFKKHLKYMKSNNKIIKLYSYSSHKNLFFETKRLEHIYIYLLVNGISKERIMIIHNKTKQDSIHYKKNRNFIRIKYETKGNL
jgi:hypothetical protein